jgi:hypothetical protein
MDTFQRNTVRYFRKVKEDMKNLQAQLTDLGNKIDELKEMTKEMKAKAKRR